MTFPRRLALKEFFPNSEFIISQCWYRNSLILNAFSSRSSPFKQISCIHIYDFGANISAKRMTWLNSNKMPTRLAQWLPFKGRMRGVDFGMHVSLFPLGASIIHKSVLRYLAGRIKPLCKAKARSSTFCCWRSTGHLPGRKNLRRGWLTSACRTTGRWDSPGGSRRASPPHSGCAWWWARTAPGGGGRRQVRQPGEP